MERKKPIPSFLPPQRYGSKQPFLCATLDFLLRALTPSNPWLKLHERRLVGTRGICNRAKCRTRASTLHVMRPEVWLLGTVALCAESPATERSSFTPAHLRELRDTTQSLFRHGWDAYMAYGFPADEIKPFSCVPYGPQFTAADDIHLDALGNVSLTLLDNLDTLLIMQEWGRLETALDYLHDNSAGFFEQDHLIQVFEASIRWLGGLLSTHLALTDGVYKHPEYVALAEKYDGFLLDMAYDLGLRLIPVYRTPSLLPLPRINLAKGIGAVKKGDNSQGCTAGATTPFLEFTLLLRLTGDEVFEVLTKKTFYKIWDARLPLGLLPMTFDPVKNWWVDCVTGIGALVDSFYEYALKGAILFDDNSLMSVFQRSYRALLSHLGRKGSKDGYMYFGNIDAIGGGAVSFWIDLLSAFWPGVQVLAGRLSDAVRSHLVFLKVWNVFDALPERWNYQALPIQANVSPEDLHQLQMETSVSLEWYPLRPEFIESSYYLYRATRDPLYLQIGARILGLFELRFKAPCGFGGYQDVRKGNLQDRMETFVLGELLKYLYLLFDENDESYVHSEQMKSKNWIFSTEAHPLWLGEAYAKKSRDAFKDKVRTFSFAEHLLSNKNHKKSMWRSFKTQVNTLGPEVDEIDVKEHPLLRPVAEELESCETAPSQWNSSRPRFLNSAFFGMGQVFLPEKDFTNTLKRPLHLENAPAIEMTQSFRYIYGLDDNYICTRDSTTQRTELVIGALSRPEEYKTYIAQENISDTDFVRGDMVMPRLSGRVKVEHLAADSIDNDRNLVTYESLRKMSGENVTHGSEVLRVYEVNGRDVASDSNVWTKRDTLNQLGGAFRAREDGSVFIHDKFVANLRAY